MTFNGLSEQWMRRLLVGAAKSATKASRTELSENYKDQVEFVAKALTGKSEPSGLEAFNAAYCSGVRRIISRAWS